MDIRMPGKKGNEVAARMRTVKALERTPIVLMTAYSMTDAERAELLERDGADRVIQKPLPEFDQLRKLLHDLVEAKREVVSAASTDALPEADKSSVTVAVSKTPDPASSTEPVNATAPVPPNPAQSTDPVADEVPKSIPS
jgi:response regulator RpfG family c-di-GMP phosphodiesterase